MMVYIVMAGATYYPTGPEDIEGVFEDLDEAELFADVLRSKPPHQSGFPVYDWVRVVPWEVTPSG
jgi:hypothetical protein